MSHTSPILTLPKIIFPLPKLVFSSLYSVTGGPQSKSENRFWCLALTTARIQAAPLLLPVKSGSPSPILHSTTTGMIFLKCPFHPGEPKKRHSRPPRSDRRLSWGSFPRSQCMSLLTCHTDLPTEPRRSPWALLPLLLVLSHFPAMLSTASLTITVPHPPMPTSFIKASVLPPLTFAPTLLLSFNNLYKMITGLPCLPVWDTPWGHQFFVDKALGFCFLAFLFFMNLSTWHSSTL